MASSLVRVMSPTPTPALFDTLTPREREVALALATGLTCREIAPMMNISIKTVDTHRQHVLEKLELKNNVELCRAMIREGRITP